MVPITPTVEILKNRANKIATPFYKLTVLSKMFIAPKNSIKQTNVNTCTKPAMNHF